MFEDEFLLDADCLILILLANDLYYYTSEQKEVTHTRRCRRASGGCVWKYAQKSSIIMLDLKKSSIILSFQYTIPEPYISSQFSYERQSGSGIK